VKWRLDIEIKGLYWENKSGVSSIRTSRIKEKGYCVIVCICACAFLKWRRR